MMHIGLIGYGSIGRALHERLRQDPQARFTALVRSEPSPMPEDLVTVRSVPEFLARAPDLCVECAGHAAVHDHAEAILKSGRALMLASVGALADSDLYARLQNAMKHSGGQILLPSGAIGGLDLLCAVSGDGACSVSYQGIKPPAAWKGSPAEARVDLDSINEATPFFEGSARDAALAFPKNANVVAALALAGGGFDAMTVALIADPEARGNTHRYTVTSPYCSYEMVVENTPTAGNARTSVTTVLSLMNDINRFFGR
ncbi:aspartate dehydrogenase [Cognatishimia sp. F0-27]|uniref:aspartate dehydrogenase n=1 Tax=Cognatishimia sp. F0-27 TaxID=2816855 RepID=UPI001D0CA2F9|nr:aspartate dehydrogenase [Cognatishimia sp. F0-27]MCC1491344.1 aspartate dehydrogenase [Cognatishimia sp. F0-27]